MFRLSFKIIFILLSINLFAQDPPHGDDFDLDCSLCHNSDSWNVDLTKVEFDHSQTKFSLAGQHQVVDCKSCHTSLVFSDAETDCMSCHKDVHQGTVGFDCASCHTPSTWIVKNIIGIHQSSRFPLVGAHKSADCAQCHSGFSELRFDVENVDCYACHIQDYNAARSPDHIAANFSTDCQECHQVNAISWNTTNVNHSFFPLTGGHALPSCFSCHQQNTFSGLDPQCVSCHQDTYNSTTNPNHSTAGIPTTCEVCHSINSWIPAQFNHNLTSFPLVGKHTTAQCTDCHTSGYTGTPSECYACHQQDYQSTTNPNHTTAGIPTTCEVCHTSNGWTPAQFNHDLTEFPLTGKHINVNCSDCHATGYTNTPQDCYACHQQDYQSTNDPNHVTAQYPTDCLLCHSTAGWEGATFDHNQSGFPLTGSHTTVACATCHTNGYTGTPTECNACHNQDYQATTNPNHITAGIPNTCEVCHSTTAWSPAQFDHSITQFPLTGSHISVACATCHTNGYTGTSSECYACHQQDFESTTDPNHVAANYPHDCEVCHNTSNWQDATFDHNITQFPLTGAHVTVACATCHTSGYTGTPTDCIACHQTDYNNTTNPNHQAAGFPTSCVDCHTTTAWDPATFDHDNQYFPIYSGEHQGEWNLCADCHTVPNNFSVFSCIDCHEHNQNDMDNEHQGVQGYNYNSADCFACHPQGRKEGAFNHATSNFALVGEHLITDCIQCHQSGYSNTPTLCSDCHINVYNSAVNPNHQALGLSTDCSTCHTPSADWQPATFPQHNQVYQLLGRHAEIANNCASCHNGNYTTTPDQCVGCHQNDFNSAVNPNHTAAGIPTTCEQCHNSTNWIPSTFDHATTGFTLTGSHQPLQCSSCHSGTLSGLNNLCISCHQDDFNIAPNHTAQSYPTNCELCHVTTLWSQTSFDHNNTNFPLTGSHTTATCQQCHSSGYTGTSTECYSCHQAAFNNAVNPNHTAAGIPTTCESCHNSTAWIPSTFSHTTTGFELLGAHQPLQCSSCHNGTLTGLDNQCVSCHLTDFNSAPNHVSQSYPTTCELCHNSVDWNQTSFNHSNTNFPLTGAHTTATCNECHSSGYTGTPTQCYACHQTDYQQSVNPSHTALVLATTCETCHTTNPGWAPATFPVHNNFYQLIGAHLQVNNCADCHQGNYNNTPNTCMGCHSTDYNGTTDPPHQTLNFSENCLTCHTMNGWTPASFNHSFFPLGSHHNNVNCNECHSETNYQPQCLSCHMEDFLDEHDLGDRTDCWNCHDTGDWDNKLINPKLKNIRTD